MAENTDEKIEHIVDTLKRLMYGSVEVTVHNGEITQIDTTEKKRFSLQKSQKKKSEKEK